MKHITVKILVLTFVSFIILFAFSTCKKSTDCIGVVIVKYQSDTTKVASNIKVTMTKGQIRAEGMTDSNGEFQYTFKLEAILDVIAVKDSDSVSPKMYGSGVIKLKPSATVRKTVFIK